MTGLRRIFEIIARWIDAVAAAIVATVGWFRFPRVVQLVEDGAGAFLLRRGKDSRAASAGERVAIENGRIVGAGDVGALLRGNRAELVLNPARFVFRPLELPRRAADFLDGVVRSQIDRLTPWTAGDAAFGWSPPKEAGPDRIMVTVAATARAQVAPYVRALAGHKPESIAVVTLMQDAGGGFTPIRVLSEKASAALDVSRVRRALTTVLVLAVLVATIAVGTATVIGANLTARQDELARRIAERRAAIRAGGDTGVATSAQQRLEVRKHETPSSVIVLEVLSQILPDHTYVTEFRIEGDKLRLIGVTRDAPSLIRLIEQSSHFTRATFFAPTTRQPSDPGERFHIEARIELVYSPRS